MLYEKLLGLREEIMIFSWIYGVHERIKKRRSLVLKGTPLYILVTIMIWFVWPVYRQI